MAALALPAAPARTRTRSRSRSLLTLCLLALGPTLPALAQDSAPLRVVVRVCNARDAQALQRLRGQTSDLSLALLVREDAALEPLLAGQLDRAQVLARELDAAAVVWFSAPVEGSLVVYVATPADGRVFARRLEPATETAADPAAPVSSALLEQSALVVRFALKGLTEGGTIGVEGRAALAQAQVEFEAPQPAARSDEPPRERSADTDAETTIASESESERHAIWLALGYEGAIDGFAPEGQHAIAARGSWTFSDYEAALAITGGVPITRAEPLVTVRLARVRLSAGLARGFALGPRFAVTAGVQAGALLQLRETIDAELPATARPSQWNAALQVGPEAALLYRSGRFGLRLCAALDVLPSPTHFVYRNDEGERESAQPFQVQPRFGLAMELAP